MSYRRKKESIVAKITEGFLEVAVDAALIGIYYNLEFPKYARNQRWKLGRETEERLGKVNYQTIKRAFIHLKKKGLIQVVREANTLPKITKEGLKRLSSLLPHYDKERVWDGRVYLVTYDFPVSKNNERNVLRDILKKVRCGMLQESVWITPYNPTEILKERLSGRRVNDLVLISSLGKDGTIGETDLSELLTKAFSLSEINEKYLDLIREDQERKITRDQFIFRFFSILKEDPQLPFELLPEWWMGERAYELYRKYVVNREIATN